MVRFEDIHFDCVRYSGYKPCIYGNECAGCPHYEPQPHSGPEWKPTLHVLQYDRLPPSPNILIVKTGALGDVLRTTTILHPLRRRFPGAHVTWVTAAGAVPLLAGTRMIDELLVMESPEANNLPSRHFDLLVNLEKEGAPLVLAGQIQADARACYCPTPWGAAAIYNPEAIYALQLGINDDLKFFKNQKSYPQIIAEMAGLDFQRDPYILEIESRAVDRSQKIRQEIVTATEGRFVPIIGLNTGCGAVFRTKQWTLEGWAGLARTMNSLYPGRVLLMGGLAELELNREIMLRVPQLIDTGNNNPLEEFFGIIEACDIVVTSDSLGMHIAIARKKRTVGLFGSTSHHEIDLYDRGEKVITDFPCSPCYLKTCDKSPTCMEAMSAEIVGQAVMRQVRAITDCLQDA